MNGQEESCALIKRQLLVSEGEQCGMFRDTLAVILDRYLVLDDTQSSGI